MPEYPFERPILRTLLARLRESRRFIQVLAGPRQAGKTTMARQALAKLDHPSHFASADDPQLRDRAWIVTQWEQARRLTSSGEGLLVLDEVQKIPAWSDVVKLLWDEDTRNNLPLQVLLLGSAPLLIERGLSDSLAGRFELVRATHWRFGEMRAAFGWDIDRFLFFGGLPGSASLIGDEMRWAHYVNDSLVETTISRDVLITTEIRNPALLRQTYGAALDHSGQILSYTKILGQLQTRGNTSTIANYLQLLGAAGLVTGIPKYSGSAASSRKSSPKLFALDPGFLGAASGVSMSVARSNPALWGRMVETAVGAHLINAAPGARASVSYWRDRDREVDLVFERSASVVAIEVTSGRRKSGLPGLDAFMSRFEGTVNVRPMLVGGQGMPIEEFLDTDPADLFPA